MCTCGKKRYEKGDFDKNRYQFYVKIILLIDTWHVVYIFLMIALGVNFPNIYGVHSVESLEMLNFLAWNIAILLKTKKGQTMVVRDHIAACHDAIDTTSCVCEQ